MPHLCDYEGWAIFMDCDMLCRADIYKLTSEVWWQRGDHAVSVVKHNYTPRSTTKFLGNKQFTYPRKNWSSLMLFNCEACQDLTPEYVNSATGAQLHQFDWLNDHQIGELPRGWNHLVGEYPYDRDAKLVHFTEGGPYFKDYADCDYAEEWRAERDDMLKVIDGSQ